MTFRMIVQLWNTNTSAFVLCDADLTENYMYISMKFGTGVRIFCWEVDDLIVLPSNQLDITTTPPLLSFPELLLPFLTEKLRLTMVH